MAVRQDDQPSEGTAIDRTSYVPVYHQLATMLEHAIASGEIHAGVRLPSETELCARYGTSRMTVRRAIAHLTQRGLTRPERGRGVFVEPMGLPQAQFGLHRLRDIFGGDTSGVEILHAKVVKADQKIAKELGIRRGNRALHLRRLLTQQDEPVAYHEAFLVDDPALLEAERSCGYFRGLLGRGSFDSPYRSGIIELQVASLTAEQAEALGRKEGEPAWVLEHTFFAPDGRPLSWGLIMLPGGLLRFPTRIGPATEPKTESSR